MSTSWQDPYRSTKPQPVITDRRLCRVQAQGISAQRVPHPECRLLLGRVVPERLTEFWPVTLTTLTFS